jgi:hypothetical protein
VQYLLDLYMKASGLMASGLIEARRLVAQNLPMEARRLGTAFFEVQRLLIRRHWD